MANYQIPIGVNAEQLLNPINQAIELIEQTGQVATEASREISTGFANGGRAAQDLERRIQPVTGNLNDVISVSRRVQEGVSNAFNERNINTNSVLAKVNEFKAKLQQIEINKRIGIEVEQGAIQELELAIREMQQGFPGIQAELNQQVAFFDNAVKQSRQNIAQLNADIAQMETQLAGQAPGAERTANEGDLGAARQSLLEEQALLDQNSSSLSQYQSVSRELVGNIQNANRAVSELTQGQVTVGSTFEQVYGELQPLTTRLGELEDRMYELALAGQRDTQEFRDLQAEAIRMRQTIQEVDASVDTMAKRSGRLEAYVSVANGMVGAFTAAQGAVALFAGENEEMNEVLTRVMSAMAILQGLQATLEIFNKENAASILFTSGARSTEAQSTTLQTNANNVHTIALNAETAAQLAATAAATADASITQAGAAADAAAAAASATDTAAQISSTAATIADTAATTAQTEASVANTAATAVAASTTNSLAAAQTSSAATATNNVAAQGAQTTAMTASSIAAGVLGFALKALGIGLVITAVAALVEYWDELKDAMQKLLPAGQSIGKMFDTLKSYVFGAGEAIVKALITPVNAWMKVLAGDFKGAFEVLKNGLNLTANFQTGFNRQQLRNQQKYLNEKEEAEIKAAQRDLDRRKNRGEDVYKQQQDLYKREISLKKKMRDDTDEVQKKMEDDQDKRYAENQRKAEAARKKAEADAKAAEQKRKQEAQKAEAERKRNLDLIDKYQAEIRKLAVYNIGETNEFGDEFIREADAIHAEAENRLADLKKDNATTLEAKERQAVLEFYILHNAEIREKEVWDRRAKNIAAIKLESLKIMNDLNKEGRDNEMNSLELEAEESKANIRDRFKNDYALREYLVEKTTKDLEEKKKALNLKYDQKELDNQLEKAEIMLELAQKTGQKTEKQEAQHQLALLEVQKQAAEAQLNLILNSGIDQDELAVLQARLKVKKIKDAIAEESKKGKTFDMMEWLGIGSGWSGEQMDSIKQAAGDLLNNISQITDGLVEQYQRQIDKKQETIDQINGEIDDLEGQLDKEKELRDQGLANNYENIQKELEQKKAQRDEEIRQQKEMVKKQEEIKKAQMAVDTAVQLVNMITSATNIFNSLSSIPFVGVPLAIALIGTMFGAFAITKAKAFQAIKGGQQYGEGGWIDGYSHAQGGKKYVSDSGDVTELEAGEFVVKKKVAEKYPGFLEAFNNGSLNKLSFAELSAIGIMDALGISFANDDVHQSVKDGEYLKATVNNFSISAGPSYDFSSIDENISYLASRKKEDEQHSEDSTHYIVRKGTRVTKIKKK